jgi:hypothetical protein
VEGSITQKKRKWLKPNDPTKFKLYYPPPRPIYELPKGKKTEAWDNWVRSMMMDTRYSGTERSILIAIALHYNLNTGECFPMHGRVAVEAGLDPNPTGMKAVQRAVSKAVSLGWLSRVFHRGGPGEKNQANHYELTVPQSIWDILANVGPQEDRPDKNPLPTGQNDGGDRTLAPHNREENREVEPLYYHKARLRREGLESEEVPASPVHRKSTSFEEAIARMDGIIGRESE